MQGILFAPPLAFHGADPAKNVVLQVHDLLQVFGFRDGEEDRIRGQVGVERFIVLLFEDGVRREEDEQSVVPVRGHGRCLRRIAMLLCP